MGVAAKAVGKNDYVPSIRRLDKLTIIFYKKDEIFARADNGTTVLCHRWFSNIRGFYKHNWEPFQKTLKNKSNLTLIDVMVLARKYEIDMMSSSRWPEEEVNGKLQDIH